MTRLLGRFRTLPWILATLLAGALVTCGGRERAELAPPAPLSLLVLDPAEGATLNVPTTPVRGKVLGGRALLGFNGKALALAADGSFATTLTLTEGENRLTFDVWPESASGRGSDLLPNTPPALHLVRLVVFQRPALAVQFTTPAEGTVLKVSPAQVGGLVSETDAAVTLNGLPALVDSEGRFTATVPLVPGPNTLRAEASAAGGRKAQALRTISFVPPVAPVVHILEPAEGLITNAASLPVSGTTTDPAATLKVQGTAVPVNPDGRWSVTLRPPEGPLTITAEAINSDGLAGTDARHLQIDRTPPVIQLDAPPPSPTRLTQLPLAGKVMDATSCQLWLQEAATALTGPPAAARFSTAVALLEGPNTLSFRAVDAAGNVATLLLTVVRDTQGPGITLDPLPPDGECTLAVSGRAADAAGAVTFTRDGAPLPSTGNAFAFLWSLSPGSNSTTLRATDALGNASEVVLTRSCTPPPPPPPPPPSALVLSVDSPLEGAAFTQPSAPVGGRVSPAGAAVAVNGFQLPVSGDGYFNGAVPLVLGANTLSFLATDPDGRSATETRHVSYSTGGGGGAAPVITFDDPRDGFATSARSITVLGHVDDPKAALKLQGKDVPLDDQGRFSLTLTAEREGVLGIRAEASNAHGTGRNAMYVSFQWSGLQMAWAPPTPAEGARLTSRNLTSAVTLSRAALVDLNGQPGVLEPNESGPHPFRAQAELSVEEGVVLLTATAVDGGGHRASLSRSLAVGLTAPTIAFTAPAFDPGGSFRTLQTGVTVTGTVTAPEVVKPLTLTLNGQAVTLDAQGGFSWTFSSLGFGSNALQAVAANAFGQRSSADRTVERIQDGGGDLAPKVTVESPLEGFATGSATLPVVGRVNQAGLTVKVQNRVVVVDPLTLRFTAPAALAVGANTLQVSATDGQGRTDAVAIHGTRYEAGQIKYRWDLPANGARLSSHTVEAAGQADQPGIVGLSINGTPMALSGSGASGAFQGRLVLPRGPQSLLLEAQTLAGERFTERREIIIDPPLPRIVLDAPASARPGEQITLTVKPAPGTTLSRADLSWNGALLAQVQEPFPAQTAAVPMDATAGTKLLVEAVGTDLEGETVTARTYVVVLAGGGSGGGPLVLAGFDDRSGLLLPGATARIDAGDPLPMGDAGLVTLPSLLPASWVKVDKPGFVPQWRRGDQRGSKVQALFDARLTPLDPAVDVSASAYAGTFAQGAFELAIPGGALSAAGKLSLTPLGTQGLPALLPKGWSAVSALWLQLEGATLTAPATLKLTAPAAVPAAGLVWARWDETARAWVALSLPASLAALPLPAVGGHALLAADPAPLAPPPAVAGQALQGTAEGSWRPGLAAEGAVDPALLPTVEAISGARAAAKLELGFGGHDPVASGTALLAEIVETYTLVSQALIEPEKRAQDGVAARYVLGVDKTGAPTLRSMADGLALELPVRMSRTFQSTELVEGLIQVGFYHEDQVIAVGGELIGANGGPIIRDGITASFEAGAFAAPTLVRVQGDPVESWGGLWPELQDQGQVAASFSVELSGSLLKGMTLSVAELGTVPSGIVPLLVQRRIVADQRVLVAVGAMALEAGAWKLSLPAESNPILEGGSFAVLVPTKAWAWVTGTVSMPQGLAQVIRRALAAKGDGSTRTLSLSPSSPSSLFKKENDELTGMKGMKGINENKLVSTIPSGDVAVKDALVSGNFLQAASGVTGVFAIPVVAPASGKAKLTGQRWDLGLTGSVEVDVPSSSNALRLTTVPFAIAAVLPSENTVVDLSAVFSVLTTAPMDPGSLAGVKLFRTDPTAVELAVRKQLSIDGRTLVITPELALAQGTNFLLVVEGLKSLAGETAARIERKVATAAAPPPPAEADFTRITLSYPNASFDIEMTIPAGAIPAGASILIEGLGMGYTYTGTMPNGELKLTIRASLGERIRITVQIGGRTTEGYVSRYAANDGSGKVTVGVDGGEVQAADRSGATVILPPGALEAPVEMKLAFSPQRPAELHADYATEKVTGMLTLSFDRETALKLQPLWKFPLPEGTPNTTVRPPGLGPYAVYVKETSYELDGSPCEVWSLKDSARVKSASLESFGGLPEADWEGWGVPGFLTNPLARAAVKHANSLTIPRHFFVGMFLWDLTAMSIDSGEHYLSGQVDRLFTDIPEQKPLPNVPVFAASLFSAPGTVGRAGRLVQYTGMNGRYLLMSSLLGELIRDGARLMAVDPDFGVTARATGHPSALSGSFGSLFMAPTMVLRVEPSDREDRVAPWADLNFEGHDVISTEEARYLGGGTDGEIFAVVNGYDNRNHEQLNVEIRVDGIKVPEADVAFSRAGGAGKWKARLRKLLTGIHAVEASVKDQSNNQTRLQRTLRLLDFGSELPVNPAKAPTFSLLLDGDLDHVQPDAMLKVKFSEPVTGVSTASLVLEKQTGAAWEAVTCRLLASNGAAAASQRVHTVFIIPNVRMETARTYRVRGTPAIVDFDDPPKPLAQAPVTFTVANYEQVGEDFALPETDIKRIATLGGRTFVAVTERIYMIRAGGATTAQAVPFGVGTTADIGGFPNFLGQGITEMRVFRQVSVSDFLMDLLVVTTVPMVGGSDQQGALWVFNACNANPLPRLLFGVSLGPGSTGYAPSVDCAGGFITVGRLTASALVVSLAAGVQDWSDTLVHAVVRPGGANQKAILQPFYLVNPEGPEFPSNLGVAMLPAGAGGTGDLGIVVGYPGSGIRAGQPLRGIPAVILPVNATTGALIQQPPYVPLSGSPTPGPSEADRRAFPGPDFNAAATRVAVIPNLIAKRPDGSQVQLNLALGQTSRPSSFGGPSLVIVNEQNPAAPVFLGSWPVAAFGTGSDGAPRAYDLPRVTPSVDPITNLVAIPVRFTDTGKVQWFVVDFSPLTPDGSRPASPRIVARVPAEGQYGSFHNGLLAVQAVGGVKILKIAPGVANVDTGECVLKLSTTLLIDDGPEAEGNQAVGSGFNLLHLKGRIDEGPIQSLTRMPELSISLDDGDFQSGPSFTQDVLSKTYRKIKIRVVTTTGLRRKLRLWLSDNGGMHSERQSYADHLSAKPIEQWMWEYRP